MPDRLLVIEDHPLYRDALVALLREAFADAEVLSASSAEEGVRMATDLPDLRLILLDLNLPGACGTEAVSAFYRCHPLATTVVISGSEDRRDVAAAFRAGARVFVSKHVAREVMQAAIRRVLSVQLSNPEWVRVSGSSIFAEDPVLPLNRRQHEILALLARGLTNREISAQVGLAEITVKQHMTVIFRVLGVENRAQALLAIRRFGLTE